jgi:hypothetical protein
MAAPRKPQDRKAKDVKEESGVHIPFEFEHNGQTYHLAAGDTLTVGFARKMRHLSQGDQVFLLIEALADEEALAAIDDMHAEEFETFQKAWKQHSGITPGE